jgi:hypothetical protein
MVGHPLRQRAPAAVPSRAAQLIVFILIIAEHETMICAAALAG